jgi:hypothetical protein
LQFLKKKADIDQFLNELPLYWQTSRNAGDCIMGMM